MEATTDFTLEDFLRWDLQHLKDYLAKRGISRTGRKAELAALAFSCSVMKKPLTDEYKSKIEQTFKDHQNILQLPCGLVIPDPSTITERWVPETDEGMRFWPPLNIVDMADHFGHLRANEQRNNLLSEYKAGKAFDYYKSEWLKQIFYNSLNSCSVSSPGCEKYCFLKAKCTPSQRIHDPDHEVWVLLTKETGQVHRAYCNCAAG